MLKLSFEKIRVKIERVKEKLEKIKGIFGTRL